MLSTLGTSAARARRALESGSPGPDVWRRRHGGILTLVAIHAVALPLFGLAQGVEAIHAFLEGGIIAALGLGASWGRLPRRLRMVIASAALVTSSAVLVHFSGGYIEAHFHFFVMLGVIMLYQDWVAYAVAVGYVVVHHGIAGMLDPASVFNHPSAATQPWLWAGIHAVFVLGLSIAHLVAARAMDQAARAREGAERALAETERRQKEIVEHSTNLFFSHTPDHRLTYVSPQTQKFLGCTPEEALKRWTEFVTDHPINKAGMEKTERAIQTGRSQGSYELQLQRVDGLRIWVEVSETPVVREGRTVAIVGALTDITERKKAQEDSSRLAALVKASTDGIVGKSLDGTITSWNMGAEKIYGFRETEAVGRSAHELFSPSDDSLEQDLLARVGAGEAVQYHDVERFRKNGTRVIVSLSASPVRDAQGKVIGVVTIQRDVTEHRRESAKVRTLTRLNQAILDHMPAGVLHMDSDGTINYENPYLLRVLGQRDEEAPRGWRGNFFEVETVRENREFLDKVRGALRGEPFADHDLVGYRSLYGREMDLSVTGVPIFTDDNTKNSVNGAILLVSDITARRKIEEERARNRERAREIAHLREVDGFKTQFINAAAHELNTPLTPMRMQLHLLRADPEQNLTASQRRSIEILGRNFHRYDRLVQDLLNAARFQAGKLGISREPTDVARVVTDAVKPFEDLARASGVRVETSVASDLHTLGDAQRLAQVMDNLLANALRFTPAGGLVSVQAARSSGSIVVSVKDTGHGLDMELAPRLFQPFSQIHEPTKVKGGSGLGLYICRGIVELHGGRIWCESEGLGKGSRFAFSLPIDG